MKEVLLFLAAVVVPIMLVGAMYKQRLCKRSDWMRGLLAAEELYQEHNCLQLVKEFYYEKVVSTQDFGEGFGAYIANKEVRV